MLRLLDALGSGESPHKGVAEVLQLNAPADLDSLLQQAEQLRDGGYRQLAYLPEGKAG